MGLETPGQTPETNNNEHELFDEELIQDKLQEITEKILGLVEENPRFDANSKWWTLVYGLGQRIGVDAVDAALEKQGWNTDTFPEELLATLSFKPEVIFKLRRT
jgi:hypothetical protein